MADELNGASAVAEVFRLVDITTSLTCGATRCKIAATMTLIAVA